MDNPSLLSIVQDILNDISGDEVNSIQDTTESMQVAAIVRSAWLDMMTSRNWDFTKELIQPSSVFGVNAPTTAFFDNSMKELIFVNYSISRQPGDPNPEIRCLKYLHPDQFINYCNQRDLSSPNVKESYDASGIAIRILNNQGPTYYTSFDERSITLDSYNSDVETNISVDNFQAYAYVIPDWVHEDNAIPVLPLEAIPMLTEEAKSRAAAKLRQQPDQKSEQEAYRQRKFLARKQWAYAGGIRFPNYGRSPRSIQDRVVCDPTFKRPPY